MEYLQITNVSKHIMFYIFYDNYYCGSFAEVKMGYIPGDCIKGHRMLRITFGLHRYLPRQKKSCVNSIPIGLKDTFEAYFVIDVRIEPLTFQKWKF